MLVTKRCNLCGGIINADEDTYGLCIKQYSGSKVTQLDNLLICRFCEKDILDTMRGISNEGVGKDAAVLPGIPER